MDQKKHFMNYRTPADMHGDGVYFNEELLAKKKQLDEQIRKIEKRQKEN